MESERLEELLNEIDIIYVSNLPYLRRFIVSSISTDTRSLKKGELFIALKGEKYDANKFIDRAIESGSACVIFQMKSYDIVKKIIKQYPNVLFIGVEDTLDTYSKMAGNYLKKFNQLKKLAITGSSGKTTMRGLISSVLSGKYNVIASEKSYNNLIGVSKTIFLIDRKHEFYVQEVGTNHPGEIAQLAGIVNPGAALVTNIGPAHIGYFGSIENIAEEKKQLLIGLDKNGIAFINQDDSFADFLSNGLSADIVYFGLNGNSDIEIKRIGINDSIFFYKNIEIRLHLPGIHNILNAVGAITVGFEYGLSIDKIKNALERYYPEEGRGFLVEVKGIKIIDESYNANPLSVKAAIEYLSEVKIDGKKHFVFGDMAELGPYSEKYHREVANYLKGSKINYTYTIGDKTLFTYEECRKIVKLKITHFNEIDSLLNELVSNLNDGDLILIKGSRIMNLDRLVESLKKELNNR